MLKAFRKISRKVSIPLLMGFLLSLPLSTSILCIEADGTSSIENVPLGMCEASAHSNQDSTTSKSDSFSDEHQDCIDCTDVSLSQTLSTKVQNELDHSITPDILIAKGTSFEVPIYTEPIVSFIPFQDYTPNQLHKHLQTIVLII